MVNGRRKNTTDLRAELSPAMRGWTKLQDRLIAHFKTQPQLMGRRPVSTDRWPRVPSPVSLGVVCPVDARGLIVGPKIGFVQNKCIEFSLLSGGMVHLSDVALCNNKFSAGETGSHVILGINNSWPWILHGVAPVAAPRQKTDALTCRQGRRRRCARNP